MTDGSQSSAAHGTHGIPLHSAGDVWDNLLQTLPSSQSFNLCNCEFPEDHKNPAHLVQGSLRGVRHEDTVLSSRERRILKPRDRMATPRGNHRSKSGWMLCACSVPSLAQVSAWWTLQFLPSLSALDAGSQASVPGAGLRRHLVASLRTAAYSCSACHQHRTRGQSAFGSLK